MNEASDNLGAVAKDFRASLPNVVAGFIIAGLMAAAGTALAIWFWGDAIQNGFEIPFYAKKGMCWLALLIGTPVIIGLLLGAFFLLKFTRTLITQTIRIREHGLELSDNTKSVELRWDQITKIVEHTIYERPPILKPPAIYLLPKIASKSYELHAPLRNEPVVIGRNQVRSITEFGELLLEAARRHGIPIGYEESHH